MPSCPDDGVQLVTAALREVEVELNVIATRGKGDDFLFVEGKSGPHESPEVLIQRKGGDVVIFGDVVVDEFLLGGKGDVIVHNRCGGESSCAEGNANRGRKFDVAALTTRITTPLIGCRAGQHEMEGSAVAQPVAAVGVGTHFQPHTAGGEPLHDGCGDEGGAFGLLAVGEVCERDMRIGAQGNIVAVMLQRTEKIPHLHHPVFHVAVNGRRHVPFTAVIRYEIGVELRFGW